MRTRRVVEVLKWLTLVLLIVTLLLLNTHLLIYYRHHTITPVLQNTPSIDVVQVKPSLIIEIPTIPKIIHLMWAERLVPTANLQFVSKWVQHNPDWKIWFWTNSDFDRLLNSRYPHLQSDYRQLHEHDKIVSRRYFIVHQYGGLWADLDVESLKPLEPLLRNQTCILSQEPLMNAKLGWHIDTMIGAALFACRPGHPYFELVLNLLLVSGKDPHTLAATGSVMLSRVYFRYRELVAEMDHPLGSITVAEPDVFMPLVGESYLKSLKTDCAKLDSQSEVRKPFCDRYRPLNFVNDNIPETSYTVHHWYRNWAIGGKIDASTTDKRDIFDMVQGLERPKII